MDTDTSKVLKASFQLLAERPNLMWKTRFRVVAGHQTEAGFTATLLFFCPILVPEAKPAQVTLTITQAPGQDLTDQDGENPLTRLVRTGPILFSQLAEAAIELVELIPTHPDLVKTPLGNLQPHHLTFSFTVDGDGYFIQDKDGALQVGVRFSFTSPDVPDIHLPYTGNATSFTPWLLRSAFHSVGLPYPDPLPNS